MVCDILDWKCILVNEIIGSVVLSIIFAIILYFVIASKSKLGFDTTIVVGVPVLLIVGLMISGFSVIYALLTILAAVLLAIIFNRFIGNR